MDVLAYRDWTGVSYFLCSLLLAAAAIALLFVSLGGSASDRVEVSAVAPVSSIPAPGISIRKEVVNRPFEVAGATFTVDPAPGARWATSFHGREAGPGQRWVLAAVKVVNGSRRSFNPGLLSYLARGPRGALYAPVRAGVAGPSGLGLATGLPVGAGAEERLVFSLPDSLRHPVLAIQPVPARALEVRVPLRG
jgi:hypothetical protein